jgi:predicted transcriptional regulator
MKVIEEIDVEIGHIEYAKNMFEERLASIKDERDELREDTFIKQRSTKRLAEFFKAHGLYIVKVHTEKRTKEHYELAKHIWRSKEVLIPFIRSIPKRKKTEVIYPTDGISKAGINSIKNLCNLLTEKEWITFEKQEDAFKISATLTGSQKSFVHYSWSEEVNLYLLDKTLKNFTRSRRLKHKLFWNVQLKLIDTKEEKDVDMELDLVAQVDGRFYIFETKSGEVLAVDKWVDRTRLFKDETNRFITCTTNENLSQRMFIPCSLFALPTLEKQFNEMLEKDFPKILPPDQRKPKT